MIDKIAPDEPGVPPPDPRHDPGDQTLTCEVCGKKGSLRLRIFWERRVVHVISSRHKNLQLVGATPPDGYYDCMSITVPDLTTSFPRSGRDMLGRYAWLARLADKVRAEHAGKQGDYIAYCGLSTGFLDRAGVPKRYFDKLVRDGATDGDLVNYFDEHVDDAHRAAANKYVLDEMKDHLDEQDAEEGR